MNNKYICAFTGVVVNNDNPIPIQGYIHPIVALPASQVSSVFSKISNWHELSDNNKKVCFANLLYNSSLVTCKHSIAVTPINLINNVALATFNLLTYAQGVKDVELKFPSYVISKDTASLETFPTYLHTLEASIREYKSSIDGYKIASQAKAKDLKHDNALARWKISNKFSDEKLPSLHVSYLLSMLSLRDNQLNDYTYLLETPKHALSVSPKFSKLTLAELIDTLQTLPNYSITKYEALKQLLAKQKFTTVNAMDSAEISDELAAIAETTKNFDPATLTPIERMRLKALELSKATALQNNLSRHANNKHVSFSIVQQAKPVASQNIGDF